LELSGNKAGMFRLVLLIYRFLINCGVKLICTPRFQDPIRPTFEAWGISSSLFQQILQGLQVCCAQSTLFCVNTLFGTPGGTTIVNMDYDNEQVLNISIDDLPEEAKALVEKAV
jgi:hypothetical protein